ILQFKDIADKKNLTFTNEISNNLPQVVLGDAEFLSLLIRNLIDNAIKFTDSGQVTLKVWQINADSPQAQLVFSIQDSGIGMEDGQVEQMFSAFSQLDGSSTRKYGGMGLGLTLSKRLADLMGGNIDVESQHGIGSTFTFTTALNVPPSREKESDNQSVVIEKPVTQKSFSSIRSIPMSTAITNPVGLETFVAIEPVFDRDEEIINGLLQFNNRFEVLYESLNWTEVCAKSLEFINSSPRIDDEDFISTAMALLDASAPDSLVAQKPMVMIPSHLPNNSTMASICNSLADVGYNLTACEKGLVRLDNNILQCIETVVVNPEKTAEQSTDAEKWAQAGVRTMAMDITSKDLFEQASSIGCSFFTGSLIKKDKAVDTHETSTNKMNLLRVLNEVNRPSLSYDELAEFIRQDIEMTYKLLKFMNSAWFGFRQKISSVKHALVLLGPKEIRKWISLVVVRDIGEDQPLELLIRSLTRAKVAEHLAAKLDMNDSSCDLFLMGMLSVIDQLLGRSKSEIFNELPVTPAVKDALVNSKGIFYPIYKLILAFESGNEEECTAGATKLNINEFELRKIFLNALCWADGALKEF
ncbi:MAG TPA: HDOD domain-containing protein, partial [Phycisphaerae bacterium]|nr:HDOD domain-containing protein [Phycisphaerae bacterium]